MFVTILVGVNWLLPKKRDFIRYSVVCNHLIMILNSIQTRSVIKFFLNWTTATSCYSCTIAWLIGNFHVFHPRIGPLFKSRNINNLNLDWSNYLAGLFSWAVPCCCFLEFRWCFPRFHFCLFGPCHPKTKYSWSPTLKYPLCLNVFRMAGSEYGILVPRKLH